MMLPSDTPSSAAYSALNVSTVAISPGAGGLYQTPTRCGPWSACTISQNRSASSELCIKVTRSAMAFAANAAIPPPWCPSFRSRRATRVYPSSITCSTILSRNVSLMQIKSGLSTSRRIRAVSSAECEIHPRMLTCNTRNCLSRQRCLSLDCSSLCTLRCRPLLCSIDACDRCPLLRNRGPGLDASPSVSSGVGAKVQNSNEAIIKASAALTRTIIGDRSKFLVW